MDRSMWIIWERFHQISCVQNMSTQLVSNLFCALLKLRLACTTLIGEDRGNRSNRSANHVLENKLYLELGPCFVGFGIGDTRRNDLNVVWIGLLASEPDIGSDDNVVLSPWWCYMHYQGG